MCGIRSRGGKETKKKTSNIDFLSIGRNLPKKAMCPKKGGIKPQNPGEVVVLAKSAMFAYKSSSVRVLDE